jgi:hypothetical protein
MRREAQEENYIVYNFDLESLGWISCGEGWHHIRSLPFYGLSPLGLLRIIINF